MAVGLNFFTFNYVDVGVRWLCVHSAHFNTIYKAGANYVSQIDNQ